MMQLFQFANFNQNFATWYVTDGPVADGVEKTLTACRLNINTCAEHWNDVVIFIYRLNIARVREN